MMVVIDKIPQEEFADVLFRNSGDNSIVNSDTEEGVATNSIFYWCFFVKNIIDLPGWQIIDLLARGT